MSLWSHPPALTRETLCIRRRSIRPGDFKSFTMARTLTFCCRPLLLMYLVWQNITFYTCYNLVLPQHLYMQLQKCSCMHHDSTWAPMPSHGHPCLHTDIYAFAWISISHGHAFTWASMSSHGHMSSHGYPGSPANKKTKCSVMTQELAGVVNMHWTLHTSPLNPHSQPLFKTICLSHLTWNILSLDLTNKDVQ